ncbi:IMPACT isoform X1 [Micractinium conductrix]|uniref:IMPACT isoform X1 n=1 Tax=Micractinium conductrix TaxID=554055 RepID=A0A2P6VF48_9CHLO|nr:IMPACT isoform X1 [Micractinium conductrix]|eukprot:PSC72714.1 IMPACT isoform X1 [Micractinium conductrix]
MSSEEDDTAARADELCALQAIYGDEFVGAGSADGDASTLSFAIPDAAAQLQLTLRVHLPASYPSQDPPICELACDCVAPDVLAALAAELEGMFAPGEVVLWQWIEHLREQWESSLAPPPPAAERAAPAGDTDAALAAELQAAALLSEEGGGQRAERSQRGAVDAELEAVMAQVVGSVVHGEPFTEKRSTFQAHLAPAKSMRDVEALMELLLQNNKIRAATHNIMAYRIAQSERGTFMQDCDDDGEAAAGGRLLHLLQMVDARDVCVVVSRWYGGILLGPARFTHINNAARQLLDARGFVAFKDGGGKAGGGKGGKKRTR